MNVIGNITCSGVFTVGSMVVGGVGGFAVDRDYFENHDHSAGTYTDAEARAISGNSGAPNP